MKSLLQQNLSPPKLFSMMNEWQKDNKTFKQDLKNLGGSMRLGSYESVLIKKH